MKEITFSQAKRMYQVFTIECLIKMVDYLQIEKVYNEKIFNRTIALLWVVSNHEKMNKETREKMISYLIKMINF